MVIKGWKLLFSEQNLFQPLDSQVQPLTAVEILKFHSHKSEIWYFHKSKILYFHKSETMIFSQLIQIIWLLIPRPAIITWTKVFVSLVTAPSHTWMIIIIWLWWWWYIWWWWWCNDDDDNCIMMMVVYYMLMTVV